MQATLENMARVMRDARALSEARGLVNSGMPIPVVNEEIVRLVQSYAGVVLNNKQHVVEGMDVQVLQDVMDKLEAWDDAVGVKAVEEVAELRLKLWHSLNDAIDMLDALYDNISWKTNHPEDYEWHQQQQKFKSA